MDYRNATGNGRNRGLGGVSIALVTDNEDPKKRGRVRLEYPWREQDLESDWARIATEMTGADYGTYFLPEVGDEVLVAFENEDIHRPIVIGALWNGDVKPPADNTDGKNDLRTIVSRNGHRIEFDDAGSKGVVTVETGGGQTIVLDDDAETVRIEDASGSSVEMGSNDVSITANGTISLSGQSIELAGKSDVKVESQGTVEVSGTSQTTVSSSATVKIEGSATVGVQGGAMVEVKGGLIKLN